MNLLSPGMNLLTPGVNLLSPGFSAKGSNTEVNTTAKFSMKFKNLNS
jgi:hypothetical protein